MYVPCDAIYIHIEREDIYEHLEIFFEIQTEQNHSVSIGVLVREAVRFASNFLNNKPKGPVEAN